MSKRRLFCHPVCRDCCQLCRNRGTDIGPQCQHHTGIKVQQTTGGKGNDDPRTGGTALDHQRGNDPHQQSAQHPGNRHHTINRRTGKDLKDPFERLIFGKRLQLTAHQRHTEEQEAEPDDRGTPVGDILLRNEAQQQPEDDGGHNDPLDIKRHQLGCDRGTDIRPEDDPHCLNQRQQTRIHKTDHHHRAGTGGLDHRGDDCSRKHPHITVRRKKTQDRPHPFPRNLMKALTHQLHPENKDRKPAEHIQQHHCHNTPLLTNFDHFI